MQSHLEPGRFAGTDLIYCFYQFKTSTQRTTRNLLVGDLDVQEANEVFGHDCREYVLEDGRVRVGLSSLAMGDSSACNFAQASHLGVLLQAGALHVGELLVHAAAPPRNLLSVGLVIDDLIIIERVLTSQLAAIRDGEFTPASSRRLDAALAGYAVAPLNYSEKKTFRAVTKAIFWGSDCCGETGIVRAAPSKFWPLVLLTMRVLQLGLTTRGLLESLLGSWVAVFLLRRRLLSLIDVTFRAVQVGTSRTIIRLSPELAAELASFVSLGFLAVVELRAQPCAAIFATDASSQWQAAVSAPVSASVVSEALRHSLQKGAWSRLLSPPSAWLKEHDMLEPQQELPGEQPFAAHPLAAALAQVPQFRVLWRREYKSRVHINVAELEAYLREEARLAGRACAAKALFGLDSQVALGALVKGRSASPILNRMLSASLGPLLGSRIFPHFMFFPSALNPADDPTRHAEVRLPSLPKPDWWAALEQNDAGPLDAWLARVSSTDPEGFDQSTLVELGGSRPLVLLSNRELERRSARLDFKAPEPDSFGCGAVGSNRAAKTGGPDAPDSNRAARRKLHFERLRECKQQRRSISSQPAVPTSPAIGESVPREAQRMLEVFSPAQVFSPSSRPDFTRQGVLDLFSGRCGVARQLIRMSAPWVVTFELERGAEQDLNCLNLRARLERLVDLGAFKVIGGAPVCASFSRAVRPPVRTASQPNGLPGLTPAMHDKVRIGNSQNQWIAKLRDRALALGLWYWFENPDTSFFWSMPSWEREKPPGSPWTFRYDNCRFGTRWRKRSKIATNLSLAGARLLCCKKVRHLGLAGYSHAHKAPWTRVAQAYPAGLCRILATAAAAAAGWTSVRPMDAAACARCGSGCRVGEASNPGPRHPTPAARAAARGSSLEEQTLHSHVSGNLSTMAWASFLAWCRSSLSFDPLPSFFLCPQLLAMVLRAFGDHLYVTGQAVYLFRYAIVGAQRTSWTFRNSTCVGTFDSLGEARAPAAQDSAP